MDEVWIRLITALTGLGNKRMEQIGFLPFLLMMGISLLSSFLVSFLYTKFYQSRATGSMVHRAFPLLGLSITAIFICIQFSLPLSLGLLGALSIVRFRTPIKEPEEIGFIMLVISTSLCCATFNILFLVVILVVAIVALLLLRWGQGIFKGRLNDGMFVLTLPTSEYISSVESIMGFMEKSLPRGRLESVVENENESVLSYSFINMDTSTLPDIQKKIRTLANNIRSNLFFNRPGEV